MIYCVVSILRVKNSIINELKHALYLLQNFHPVELSDQNIYLDDTERFDIHAQIDCVLERFREQREAKLYKAAKKFVTEYEAIT